MAAPKVFVSSTCFDLGEIREQIGKFIISYGFDPVLSENGDVFFHPDLHTHDACIHEVGNCQLFILIIGGRFGGEYISDKSKSITNAEYTAARDAGIPIFTYIRKNVLSNHHIYQQNKKKDFVSEILYPAIENQEYAIDIFNFIDEVRRSRTNNALEGFENFQDIETHLRKQWAGMFFDLLKSKGVKAQIDATNHLLSGISSTSNKLEALLKSLYLSSNKDEATEEIKSIEIKSKLMDFYKTALIPEGFPTKSFILNKSRINIEDIANISPKNMNWHEYLVRCGLFEYEQNEDSEPPSISFHLFDESSPIRGFSFPIDHDVGNKLDKLFKEVVHDSTIKQRENALLSITEEF